MTRRERTQEIEFWFANRRVRESSKIGSKTLAKAAGQQARREIETAFREIARSPDMPSVTSSAPQVTRCSWDINEHTIKHSRMPAFARTRRPNRSPDSAALESIVQKDAPVLAVAQKLKPSTHKSPHTPVKFSARSALRRNLGD